MKKEVIFLLVSIIFSAQFVFSAVSTESNFIIAGCINGNERIPAGRCSLDRRFFCTEVFPILKNTMNSDACTGADGNIGLPNCCPSGYYCKKDNNNEVIGCQPRENACEVYENAGECQSMGCAWLGDGICRDTGALSCSDYATPESCVEDTLQLGTGGYGSDICLKDFYYGNKRIDRQSCKCAWQGSPEAGNCSLYYTASALIGAANSEDIFACNKVFTMWDCIDGKQEVSWTANSPSFDASEIGNFSCINDKTSFVCGQESIKMPFFSFSNFLAAFILIVFISAILPSIKTFKY